MKIVSQNEPIPAADTSRFLSQSFDDLSFHLDHSNVDLIRELRLRQWARTRYVDEGQRSPKWHPIVLDEMRRRDAELAHERSSLSLASGIVPLPPTSLRDYAEAS